MDKRIWIISLIMFINLLGVGIIFPLLPYYAESMGADYMTIGYLGTMYPLFQIFSAPLLGKISDSFGRRPVLLFSLLGTVLGFFFLGAAKNLVWLFIARIIDGASAGNTPTAFAYVADITNEKNRTQGMTRVSSAIWLGFVFGPAVGGILSQFGYSTPAYAAAIVSAGGLLLAWFFLPESLHTTDHARSEQLLFPHQQIVKLLHRTYLALIIFTSLFFECAFWLMDSTLALFLQHRFHFSSTQTGYLFTYFAVIGIISQLVFAKKLLHFYREQTLLFIAGLCVGASLCFMAISSQVSVFFILITMNAFGVSIIKPLLNSIASKSAHKDEQGSIIGTKDAVDTIATLIGPIAGTSLFSIAMGLPYVTGGIICLLALLLIVVSRQKQRDEKHAS